MANNTNQMFNMQSGQWENFDNTPSSIAGGGYDPNAPNGVNFASLLGAAGPALGAFANMAAGNRFASTSQGQAGPAADATGWRNFLHANYVANGGAKPISGVGALLPTMLSPTPGSSPEAASAASSLRDQLMSRIKAGQTPTISGTQKPSIGEQIAGYASMALPFLKFL